MPHAMTDAFALEDPPAAVASVERTPVAPERTAESRQEPETPNERAMRAATAACRATHAGRRPQG